MVPRNITPESLTETLAPTIPSSKCYHCNATRQYFVPNAKSTPEELQGLTAEQEEALRPLTINTGPHIRAQAGYRMHTGMIRFSWEAISVRQKIKSLACKRQRKQARKVYDLI